MYQGNGKALTYSMTASAAFHALLFFLYFYFVVFPPKTRNIVLSNVDLIVQEREAQARLPERSKTFNFLKLALPEIPKIAEPAMPKIAQMDIKTPDRNRRVMDIPQALAERAGRLSAAEKLEMDAGRRVAGGVKDAELDIKTERSAQAMAPRIELEEVGLNKAPAMPQGLEFEESGAVVRPQNMQELNVAVDNARRRSYAPQALSERQGSIVAARPAPVITETPQRLAEAHSAGVQLSVRQAPTISADTISMRRNEALRQAAAPAPSLEITGPLSRRKVLKYYAPPFPDWASARGILEAAVSIKFYVDNSGQVMDNAAVEKTSGYSALDRLAVDAIKRWTFEPIPGPVSQEWGIITFRFVSE